MGNTPPSPEGAAPVIDRIARPLQERDFPACLGLLDGRRAYPADILADLPSVWRTLLRDDAIVTTVAEQPGVDGPGAIAAFGASVFVTDAWVADARRGQEPYLSARTIRLELAGRSPILRRAAIRHGNAGDGLNVLVLHYAEARNLPAEARPPVRYQMFESLLEWYRGYHVKDLVQEFWDEIDPEYILKGWGRVVSEYADYYQRRGETPPANVRPYLVGITREEVAGNPGALAARLFMYTAPRLSLTPAEQRMLRQALLGRTDTELAASLGLALPTVKSRWRGIYDRVSRVAPELIAAKAGLRRGDAARGQEKRRQLLDYVRRHPEELNW